MICRFHLRPRESFRSKRKVLSFRVQGRDRSEKVLRFQSRSFGRDLKSRRSRSPTPSHWVLYTTATTSTSKLCVKQFLGMLRFDTPASLLGDRLSSEVRTSDRAQSLSCRSSQWSHQVLTAKGFGLRVLVLGTRTPRASSGFGSHTQITKASRVLLAVS